MMTSKPPRSVWDQAAWLQKRVRSLIIVPMIWLYLVATGTRLVSEYVAVGSMPTIPELGSLWLLVYLMTVLGESEVACVRHRAPRTPLHMRLPILRVGSARRRSRA